jgi:hypothetical protein
MSAVTRRALRVHSALVELRNANEDVLDALVPFFEPILEAVNGKVFDPGLFALAVRKVLRWRFTTDIAKAFIPRLERKGYLKERGSEYIVEYSPPDDLQTSNLPITDVLNKLIIEFQNFAKQVTELLNYNRTEEQLADILIRFLVSLDAYEDADFLAEIQRMQLPTEDQSVLANLEEGGTPLGQDDKYMCARFVIEVSNKNPDRIPDLARLASIGLLTEVVDDFIKPTKPEVRSDLVVAVDAPLALDYSGCSGSELQEDIRAVFHSLRTIGCSFVVFPITCDEMTNNLKSMLKLPLANRHGYTHEAIRRGDVIEDYVRAVANDPVSALRTVGIQLQATNLDQYPNLHLFFDKQRYEDFFSAVTWVKEVAPREHDATCVALVMRLRGGKHFSDLLKCRYAFVTRNNYFVTRSREYCLESRLINSIQQGPVVNQRELATIAWLRTGLDVAERVPRGHLLAVCDRVLRTRTEVKNAVAAKLKQVSPQNLSQFELLLLDNRSIRVLADQTLNNDTVVTSQNVEKLLELMQLATVPEVRDRYERQLDQERKQYEEALRERDREIARLIRERDTLYSGASTGREEKPKNEL